MVSHQLIARLNYDCIATLLFLSVSLPVCMCLCRKVRQQVETSAVSDCHFECSLTAVAPANTCGFHIIIKHTDTVQVMRNISWSLSPRVFLSLTQEMIITRESNFDTKRLLLVCANVSACQCVCVCVMPHVVLQMALGSPWRLVTYNQDEVGVFGLLGL